MANYEKNKPIPRASDNLMRMNFLIWITPEDARAELMKRVSEVIQKRRSHKDDAVMPPADIQASIAKQWQVQPGMEPPPTCHPH